MSKLAEKMRKAREQRLQIDERRALVFLRPTADDWARLRGKTGIAAAVLVVGWEGFTEADLLAGGDPHPLEFDADACTEWLADSPAQLTLLVAAVAKAFEAYLLSLEDVGKN